MTRYIYNSDNVLLGTAPGVIQGTHIPAHVSADALAAHGWHEGDAPEPPALTDEQRMARIVAARDAQLTAIDWQVLRHRDQLAAGETTSMTDADYQALLAHRQHLRDIPQDIEDGETTLDEAETELGI
jgi:hypothetical protein